MRMAGLNDASIAAELQASLMKRSITTSKATALKGREQYALYARKKYEEKLQILEDIHSLLLQGTDYAMIAAKYIKQAGAGLSAAGQGSPGTPQASLKPSTS